MLDQSEYELLRLLPSALSPAQQVFNSEPLGLMAPIGYSRGEANEDFYSIESLICGQGLPLLVLGMRFFFIKNFQLHRFITLS